jgi:hypothetical protein
MVPVCCICGKAAARWHDDEWLALGGMQEFCPEHATRIQQEFGPTQEYVWGEPQNEEGR